MDDQNEFKRNLNCSICENLINERNLKIFEDQDPMPPNYVKVKTRSLTEFIENGNLTDKIKLTKWQVPSSLNQKPVEQKLYRLNENEFHPLAYKNKSLFNSQTKSTYIENLPKKFSPFILPWWGDHSPYKTISELTSISIPKTDCLMKEKGEESNNIISRTSNINYNQQIDEQIKNKDRLFIQMIKEEENKECSQLEEQKVELEYGKRLNKDYFPEGIWKEELLPIGKKNKLNNTNMIISNETDSERMLKGNRLHTIRKGIPNRATSVIEREIDDKKYPISHPKEKQEAANQRSFSYPEESKENVHEEENQSCQMDVTICIFSYFSKARVNENYFPEYSVGEKSGDENIAIQNII